MPSTSIQCAFSAGSRLCPGIVPNGPFCRRPHPTWTAGALCCVKMQSFHMKSRSESLTVFMMYVSSVKIPETGQRNQRQMDGRVAYSHASSGDSCHPCHGEQECSVQSQMNVKIYRPGLQRSGMSQLEEGTLGTASTSDSSVRGVYGIMM